MIFMNIPKDPIMLLSCVNMLLRDKYDNPQELCKSENIDIEELEKSLMSIGYKYNPEINQFR